MSTISPKPTWVTFLNGKTGGVGMESSPSEWKWFVACSLMFPSIESEEKGRWA
jgi:hypothetical protein